MKFFLIRCLLELGNFFIDTGGLFIAAAEALIAREASK